ncbi:efflux transporter outer membrane subunit [Paraburkholderia sp. 2C]
MMNSLFNALCAFECLNLVMRRVGLSIMLVALGACAAVGSDYVSPENPSQQAYIQHEPQTISGVTGEPPQTLRDAVEVKRDWWTLLGSPELDRTVHLAIAGNWSIKAAQARLKRSSEMVRVARGGLYPQIDVGANALRQKLEATELGPQAFGFPVFSAFSTAAVFSYEPDVFGRTRRRIEQVAADEEVQRQALNAAHLDVAHATVTLALQIAASQALIAATRDIIASDQRTLDLVRSARAAGVASDRDVTAAQAQLDQDRTPLGTLQQQLDAARDSLAVLVGKVPVDWAPPDFALERLTLPDDLPLVVPSELVRDRPDIRAAQAQLHAASAAAGVATADLYPRFNLTATVGASGLMGGPVAAAWSLVGGVAAPVFHGGALKAQKRGAEDAYDAAFAQYQETVLQAFAQVAQTLHALSNDADSVQTRQQSLASADTALALARRGYNGGTLGIVQLLDAQRVQQLATLELVKARTQRFSDTIELFIVSGGGVTQSPSTEL